MQHVGAVFGTVLSDIFGVQPFGQVRVDLKGAALPDPTDRVGQFKIKLWPVKRAFAGVERIGMAGRLDRVFQRRLDVVPACLGADPFFGAGGEHDLEFLEPEVLVNPGQKIDEFGTFRFDLIFGAENMRVILGESAYPHDAMQRARGFITVARPEFGHPQRQIAVGFQALIIDLHVARAVHRFQRVDRLFAGVILVHFDDEHVFLIFVPMPGLFPKRPADHLRRVHLDIAIGALLAAHVVLQGGVDGPAIGVPEHLTGSLFLHMEQVHFAAQFAVVAFGGFLQAVQVVFEAFFVGERGAVDALQHGTVAVAAPIGSRDRHQFERIGRHLAGVLQMRAAAQVLPVAVPIHAQRLVARDGLDQLDLIGLALVLVMRDCTGAVPDFGAHGLAFVDDLFHLFLNCGEVFGHKGLVAVKVVIPAVLDHRADGDLHVGP